MALLRGARRARTVGLAGAVVALLLGTAGPATAAEGDIDHVESGAGTLRVLYSVPGIGEGRSRTWAP